MAMESVSVSSDAIAYLAYDSDSGEVSVTFQRGGSYTFELPEIEFHRWANADSVGGYFNSNIKGKY